MLFSLADIDSVFITLPDKSMINNRVILMVFVMAFKTAHAKAAKKANYASVKDI